MRAFGFLAPGMPHRQAGSARAIAAALRPLTLAAGAIRENAAEGTVVGGVLGATAGSTLSLADAAGGRFALSGGTLVAGAVATDFETAAGHQVTVRETLAGATNSPRDTVLTVTVTNLFEQPSLSALSFSGAGALRSGTAADGAVSGAAAGSTITAAGLPPGFTINGPARTWSFDGSAAAGTSNVTLTETLGDSANSPRASGVALTIAVAAPQAPGYLPASPAPYSAIGAQRVVAGYAGPLFQLRRADGTTMDVAPQAGGDYPDYAAIAAWAGGAAMTVALAYDQTGNGRHWSEATPANQPAYDPADRVGAGAPVIFDGYARGGTAGTNIAKRLSLAGVGVDQVNYGVLAGLEHTLSYNNSVVVDGRTSANASSGGYNMPTSPGQGNAAANISGISGAAVSPASLDASGVSVTGGARTVYSRGTSYAGGTRSSAVQASFVIGQSVAGGDAYNGQFRLHCLALYATAISTAQGSAIQSAINALIGKPAGYDYTVVLDGDSITEGAGSGQQKNTARYVALSLTRRAEIVNTGVSGQTMATINANRATRFPQVYAAGRPCIAFLQAGTNDLGAGVAASTLYGNASSLVGYLKGLGYKVVLCTVLPRTGSAGWTAAAEIERTGYNDLVRANAAAADLVLDLAAHPVMAAAGANADTALYVDKLHPRSLGYRWLAGAPSGTFAGPHSYYAALQATLRTISGDASYVP